MTTPVLLTAALIADVCHGRVAAGDPATVLRSFSTDTRTLAPGDTFIALAGPNFDGQAFAVEAVTRGAAAVVTRPGGPGALPPGVVSIEVDDTLDALQRLAQHVRRSSGAQVVAVTGSAGKTSTKEAAAALLSGSYAVLRNRGNLNNHIGLPLSLLELAEGADIAVVELGMNHAGEISRLVEIAEPDVRVWTNVGTAHLGFFGSMDAIAAAKAEILEKASARTLLVANADDDRVMRRVEGFPGRIVTFGIANRAEVQAVSVDDRGLAGQHARVRTPAGPLDVSLALPGAAHLANVLAAVAVAVHFEVPLEEIAARAAALAPARHRGEVLQLARGVRVLDDCYNSSPSALRRALDIVASTPVAGRRVAVLGEMLELGDQSVALHRECGRAAVAAGISLLLTVGGEPARELGRAAREAGLAPESVTHVETSDEAAIAAAAAVRPDDLVLVKGSRGVRLERVVERLAEERA
jgi:UDP-N-acetylmuramoyl-tripeptide--D-alanyl-D-alanine ligase